MESEHHREVVLVECPVCKKAYKPELGERKHPGMIIQREFPRALPYQREQLITGICSDKCWDEYLFPKDRN